MDLVTSCSKKLASFRIKELKEVLGQLGLSKQGKKTDLVSRILSIFSDAQASKAHGSTKIHSLGCEGVAKIIDDTYSKMQLPGAGDLSSKGQSSSDTNHVKPKEVVVHLDKVRCPCGSSLRTESMIQCKDSKCRVWQHIDCVIVPEKPVEDIQPEIPMCFYCELCRLSRADPFRLTVSNPLFPVKMVSCNKAPDGSSLELSMEETYALLRADREMIQRNEYELQAWCILLNDKVPFRMQWPQHSDLQANGVSLRALNRPGPQLLGINGRDDGVLITTCSHEGINRIVLSRRDTRTFVFGIRIVEQRTVQQVLSLVPTEADGEHFEDALARVRRCVGGGNAKDDADSDSDLVVVADSITVDLRCPMSGSRIKIAGRFKPCVHMHCFDLEAFIALSQQSRKWQCPICMNNYSLESVIIDQYFNRITSLMRNCAEDVTQIEVKPDCSWRSKSNGRCKDLEKWHLPDGSVCGAAVGEAKHDLGVPKQIKGEDISEDYKGLKLGIRDNQNGDWDLSKPVDVKPPLSGDQVQVNFGNNFQHIAISSGATGSYSEDPSVNKDGGMNYDFSLNNVHDLDSVSLNFDPTLNTDNGIPKGQSKHDIIVLSDSDDEEDITVISAKPVNGTQCDGSRIPYPTNQFGFGGTCSTDPTLTGRDSCGGSFNNGTNDSGIPFWSTSYPLTGPNFQLFGANVGDPNALVDVRHNSLSPLNEYGLASKNSPGETSGVVPYVSFLSNADANDSLIDNPLGAYGSEDPSLQIFLPTQPDDAPPPVHVPESTEMRKGAGLGWISLGHGSAEGGHVDPASKDGLNSKQQFTDQENDTASLLLSMNGTKSNKPNPNGKRSEGLPLNHHDRAVRPRPSLTIDTDSDE